MGWGSSFSCGGRRREGECSQSPEQDWPLCYACTTICREDRGIVLQSHTVPIHTLTHPPLPCCLLSQFIDQLQVAQWNGVTSEGHVTHDTTMLDLHHKLRREKQKIAASFPGHHCLIPRPPLSHSQAITVSFPDHHCLQYMSDHLLQALKLRTKLPIFYGSILLSLLFLNTSCEIM